MDHVEGNLAQIKAELRSIRQALDRINDRQRLPHYLGRDHRNNLGLGSLIAKGLGWL